MSRALRALTCGWALVVVLVAGVWFSAGPPLYNGQHLEPIRSDGVGYHAWTQAIADRDFGFCHYTPLEEAQAISARRGRNRCTNKYPPGLALVRLPVMFWLVDRGNDNLVISTAEHDASLWLGTFALLVASLFTLLAILRLGVRPAVANIVVLVAVFGTGLYHYATFDSSFTHATSAALLAILLWLGVRAAQADRAPPAAAVLLLSLLVVLVRPPDLPVLGVLLIGWLLWRVRPLPADRVAIAVRQSVPVVAGAAAALLFQLAYNRWSSGHWMLSSYGQEELNPGLLHEGQVLLSYERGLFIWYPAVLVLLGLALAVRRSRGWGLAAVAAIAGLTLVYGSWHSWALGGGFGHRGFVDVVPLVALAGAYALDGLRTRIAIPALVALAVCSFATIELMRGYWRGTIPFAGTTSGEYWSHVAGRDSLLP